MALKAAHLWYNSTGGLYLCVFSFWGVSIFMESHALMALPHAKDHYAYIFR